MTSSLSLAGLPQFVSLTFTITFFGMIGGALFFGLLSQRVRSEWWVVLAIESVICGIAALNYGQMRDIYAGVGGHGRFPTEFRYIDWILTVPLMLVQFPTVLGRGKRSIVFTFVLIALSLIMIVTGFFAEVTTTPQLHYGLFIAGCVAWLAMVGALVSVLGDIPEDWDSRKSNAIRRLSLFVLVGWSIYPIGFLLPTFNVPGDYRELLYNIGDLVNKVGLGLSVAVAALAEPQASSDDDDDYVEDSYDEDVVRLPVGPERSFAGSGSR